MTSFDESEVIKETPTTYRIAAVALTIIMAAGLSAATPTFADPTRMLEQTKVQQYELQAQCATQAAQLFTQQVGFQTVLQQAAQGVKYDYSNHYSDPVNKCFVLLTQTASRYIEDLWDVNSHKIIAHLERDNDGRAICSFNGRDCDKDGRIDGKTWQELIAPYMKDGPQPPTDH